MPMRAVIQYRGSPKAKARALRGAVKAANAATVKQWHRAYLPRHFESGARRRYSYQARAGELSGGGTTSGGSGGRLSYHQRKLRDKGHGRPLVWSGRTERMARRQIKITSTSKSGRGRLNVPRYVYQYRKDQRQPDKADEMTRALQVEARDLASRHGRHVRGELNRVQTVQRKRVA